MIGYARDHGRKHRRIKRGRAIANDEVLAAWDFSGHNAQTAGRLLGIGGMTVRRRLARMGLGSEYHPRRAGASALPADHPFREWRATVRAIASRFPRLTV